MSAPRDQPVATADRVVFWDVLRGFAVLGILLANIPWMSMSGMFKDMMGDFIGGDSWLDHAEFHLVRLLVDTKFVTTFSILFGAGLAFLAEKATQKGTPFGRIYSRRLLALLVFGVLHGVLLWFGDILTFYALLGFVAMWFRGLRVVTLLVWSAIFLSLNLVLWLAFGFVDPNSFVELAEENGRVLSAQETQVLQARELGEAFSSRDLAQIVPARAAIYAESQVQLLLFMGLRTLGLFLLGMALVKSGVFLRVREHAATFRRLMLIGLGIGLPIQGVQMLVAQHTEDASLRTLSFGMLYLAGLAMSLGYIGLVARWTESRLWTGLRFRLAAVGRMAFTSYITHSAVTAVIFCHLGQFDRWRRPELFLLAVAIFAFQLLLSPLWLKHFRMGPLEWVWRSLTYWQAVPLRRAQLPR